MATARLKYVNDFRSKGKVYHYFRHGGVSERLPGEPDSAEYLARYAELLAETQKKEPVGNPYLPGTVNWLVADYKMGPKFKRLAPTTQVSYAHMIEGLRDIGGDRVGKITRKHIQALRSRYRDRPRTADEFAKVCSVIFSHAVDIGEIEVNPAAGLAKLNKTKSYRAWTDEEIAAFEASNPPAALMTAFIIGLNTGQRRGDILRMGWAAYSSGRIAVTQGKTQAVLSIPAHSKLRDHLDQIVRRETLIVAGPAGGAWDLSGFAKAFRKALNAAGLPKDAHFHGLRHTAVKFLAEVGCTEFEIMAITGIKSPAIVRRYMQQANQARMADNAMNKLEAAQKNANKK